MASGSAPVAGRWGQLSWLMIGMSLFLLLLGGAYLMTSPPNFMLSSQRRAAQRLSRDLNISWTRPRTSIRGCPLLPHAICTEVAENFSVIVPSFIKRPDLTEAWLATTLDRFVQSLTRQELYCPAEVILVIAGVSTSEQAKLIHECFKHVFRASRIPSKLEVVLRQGRFYAGANRNTGVDHATRRYVVLADDDDAWHPRKLYHIVHSVSDDMVFMTHNYLVTPRNEPLTPVNWIINEPPTIITDVSLDNGLILPGCTEPSCTRVHHGHPIVLRSAWNWTRAREDLLHFQDAEFLVRLYRYCIDHLPKDTKFFHHINASLVVYYGDWWDEALSVTSRASFARYKRLQ